MAAKKLRKGDPVAWDTPQGTTRGKVVKKITRTKQVKGHTAKATPDDPQYEVKTDRTKKTAIHRAEELRKST